MAPNIVYLFLVPQFLLVAMTQYFATLIDDVKVVISKFKDANFVDLHKQLIEMIDLHWHSLKWVDYIFKNV